MALYGTDPAWSYIVEQYDRNRWHYGDPSTVQGWDRTYRNMVSTYSTRSMREAIDRHSFAYYKKHLGYYPSFDTKAQAYDWKERSKTTDRYSVSKEFEHDTFSKGSVGMLLG